MPFAKTVLELTAANKTIRSPAATFVSETAAELALDRRLP